MRISFLLAAVFVFGAVAPAHAQAPTAAAVVKKVDAFYAQMKRCTAKFTQEVTNTTFGKTSTSKGKVYVKKPGMMRWDYNAKGAKKNFISDGKTLWVVDHANKLVVKKSLAVTLLPAAITFLYGKGKLAKAFTATLDTSGTYGSLVLELTPKKASAAYSKLYLVVDATTYAVDESVVIDAAGNTNRFRFAKQDYTKAISNALFAFSPKAVPGYRVH